MCRLAKGGFRHGEALYEERRDPTQLVRAAKYTCADVQRRAANEDP